MPKQTEIGYCTNVHAGPTLPEMQANLQRFALQVKEKFSPRQAMGVGLWLAAPAAQALRASCETAAFSQWLAEAGLMPFTFNGFPHGDFHQEVVKHRVYEPTWWQKERLEYTLDLIHLLDAVLPAGKNGSISTLPIAWGNPRPENEQLAAAAQQLRHVAEVLTQLHRETGRKIVLCIEPEPGCHIQRCGDVAEFFRTWLFGGRDEQAVREHLTVCHDVCHSAVMFEPQAEAIESYAREGIKIGKVQVSSAVKADFESLSAGDRRAALDQLRLFREPRYLHQTCIGEQSAAPDFYEDLPLAIGQIADPDMPRGEWRIHFHVPIYLDQFGLLKATQGEIRDCLAALAKHSDCRHFEVETYAWDVLPAELQVPELSDGIAREMAWFANELKHYPALMG